MHDKWNLEQKNTTFLSEFSEWNVASKLDVQILDMKPSQWIGTMIVHPSQPCAKLRSARFRHPFCNFLLLLFLSCQGRWPCRVCSHAHRNIERLPCLLPLFNYWTFVTISISQWLITFDITNQGTLPLVASCSGTKMLLAHHLRTGGLKCPCFGKSRCLIIICSMDFANVYHILNDVLVYHQVVLPIDEIV